MKISKGLTTLSTTQTELGKALKVTVGRVNQLITEALLSGMTRTPMVAFSSFLLFATFLVPKQEMGQMKRLILWLRGRSTKRQNEKLQS